MATATPPRRATARARARAVTAEEQRAQRLQTMAMITGTAVLLLALMLIAPAARAATWTLDPEASSLSFGSIKAGTIGEVHEFRDLHGSVDDSGAAEVVIDTASVSTGIDLRDDRMRDMLFHVNEYPVARITADVPMDSIGDLPVGDSVVRDLSAQLTLVGETRDLPLPLIVTRLSEDRLLVRPLHLIMVQASDYKIGDGIEALREVAGLERISTAVPVTFGVTFQRDQ